MVRQRLYHTPEERTEAARRYRRSYYERYVETVMMLEDIMIYICF